MPFSDTCFCGGVHLPLPILTASFFDRLSAPFHAYPGPAVFFGGAMLLSRRGFTAYTSISKATCVKPRRRKVLQLASTHTAFGRIILVGILRQYITWIYKFETGMPERNGVFNVGVSQLYHYNGTVF